MTNETNDDATRPAWARPTTMPRMILTSEVALGSYADWWRVVGRALAAEALEDFADPHDALHAFSIVAWRVAIQFGAAHGLVLPPGAPTTCAGLPTLADCEAVGLPTQTLPLFGLTPDRHH